MNLRIMVILPILLMSMRSLAAQTTTAPIPAQITAARSIFLANAGSTPSNNQLAILYYNALYQELATGNHYRLTAAPADADLIVEISVISTSENVSYWPQYIQIVIRDPKSQSLLWSTSEEIKFAAREKYLTKNRADAIIKLAADLAALTATNAATLPPAASAK